MHDSPERDGYRGGPAAWVKLAIGVLLLACAILGLGQGYTPPGPAGEVLRNNLLRGVDATPLFYTEVDALTPER